MLCIRKMNSEWGRYVIKVDICAPLAYVLLETSQVKHNWASEASPTLGCSIEISRDISMCVCRMSNHVESRESNTRMLKVSIGR